MNNNLAEINTFRTRYKDGDDGEGVLTSQIVIEKVPGDHEGLGKGYIVHWLYEDDTAAKEVYTNKLELLELLSANL